MLLSVGDDSPGHRRSDPRQLRQFRSGGRVDVEAEADGGRRGPLVIDQRLPPDQQPGGHGQQAEAGKTGQQQLTGR